MAELPPPENQQWVVDSLAALAAKRGPQPLLGPVLEPTEAWFPDPWTPDAEGVAFIVRRLLAYAGLPLRALVVVDGEKPADDAIAWFMRIDAGQCLIGLDVGRLEDPDLLVAGLAHEVAHAWRHHHELVVDDDEEEERLTDLTAVYLGFGILLTNAAFRCRTSGELLGTMTTHRWSHDSAGYLGLATFSFALAAQATVRRLDWRERRRLAGQLETAQAACFRKSLRALRRHSALLATRLGVPPGTRAPLPPAPRDLDTAAVPAPLAWQPAEPPDLVLHNEGRAVFRLRTPTRWYDYAAGALLGGFVGLVLAAVPAVSLWPALMGVGAVAGALWGVRSAGRKAQLHCADPECDAQLPAWVATCPGCGGTFHGDVDRRDDRMEMEERLGLNRDDALEREAQEEGDDGADGEERRRREA